MGAGPKNVILLLVLACIAVVIWWVQGTEIRKTERWQRDMDRIQRRFDYWANLARTDGLSPTEEVSIVIVPSNLSKSLDIKCLIYRNVEFRMGIICPGWPAFESHGTPEWIGDED